MDPSLIRRKSATTSGLELINIHGYSLPKSELYQFSPLSGEFVYLVGSLVVVYDTVNHIQKEYLQNPKGLPYSCIEFSQDGSEMYTGELLSKEASVRFYTQSKFGKYISKTNMTTGFRTIDGIAVSPNKTFIAIHGTVRNSDKRDLKKLEIFDLNKKTSLQIHGISYKIKQFFFSKDESIYFITKDAIYQCLQKNKWSPNLKLSFSGKGRTCIDMADHEDKILIILDNSNLIVYDKKRSDFDTLELNYKEAPHCMTKFNDKLIVGCSNGVIYYSSLANLTSPRELPKPPYLGEGAVDIPEKIEYSDCKVVKASNSCIAAMFYDKTMVFYNVSESGGVEINKVIRTHCGSIFDIDCYPQAESPSHFCFVSGSIDKTLRRFIVYVNPKTGICQVNQDSMGLLCENLEHLKYEGFGKIRTLKLLPFKESKNIICGDQCGCMWIFDSTTLALVKVNEAHTNEILGIDSAPIENFMDKRAGLMLTCSKDNSIKIFDSINNFEEIRHIQDHKTAVISAQFMCDDNDSDLKIISADCKGSVNVRSMDEDLNLTEPTQKEFSGCKIFSMAVNENCFLLGCDKKVCICETRKNNSVVLKKSVLASTGTQEREYIKMETDNVSLYGIACSMKKRSLTIFDIKTGNTTLSINTGDAVTALKYTHNFKYLISSSNNGCIFIYKVPSNIEKEIMFKTTQKSLRITETPKPRAMTENEGFTQYVMETSDKDDRKAWGSDGFCRKPPIDYSRDTLPAWAKSTICEADVADNNQEFKYENKYGDFEELKQAESDGDDEDNEVEVVEVTTGKDGSEIDKDSDEENDAFNFQQTRSKKPTGVPSDYLLRESRIGNLLRSSIYEQKAKRPSEIHGQLSNLTPQTSQAVVIKTEETKKISNPVPKPDNKAEKSVKLVSSKDQVARSEPKSQKKKNIESKAKGDTMRTDSKKIKGAEFHRSNTKNEEEDQELNFDMLISNNIIEGENRNFRHQPTNKVRGTELFDKANITTSDKTPKQSANDLKIQIELRKAIESMQRASNVFNQIAANRENVSQEVKDLMLNLSISISGLQLSSYVATTQTSSMVTQGNMLYQSPEIPMYKANKCESCELSDNEADMH